MNFIAMVPFVVSHRTMASSFSDIFDFRERERERVDLLRKGLESTAVARLQFVSGLSLSSSSSSLLSKGHCFFRRRILKTE